MRHRKFWYLVNNYQLFDASASIQERIRKILGWSQQYCANISFHFIIDHCADDLYVEIRPANNKLYGQTILYTTIMIKVFFADKPCVLRQTQIFGGDIKYVMFSLEECIEECNRMSNCVSLTRFSNGECYLKSTALGTRVKEKQDSVSWLKRCSGEIIIKYLLLHMTWSRRIRTYFTQ